MSSGFPSDVLRLLGPSSVIHGGSWKQHVGYLRGTVAAAAAPGSDLEILGFGDYPTIKGDLAHWQMEVQRRNRHQNKIRVSGQCN